MTWKLDRTLAAYAATVMAMPEMAGMDREAATAEPADIEEL